MRFSFHAEQWLPHPLAQVFAFFANPENLPRLMPAWQEARITDASIVPPPAMPDPAQSAGTAIAAGAGTRLMLSFRPFPYAPFRVRWQAEIVEFAWNDRFCDRQLRGPFAYWNHCHSVAAGTRNGITGTIVTDHVDYELPFGIAGRLAHALILRRQIAGAFAYRQRRVAELLAEPKP